MLIIAFSVLNLSLLILGFYCMSPCVMALVTRRTLLLQNCPNYPEDIPVLLIKVVEGNQDSPPTQGLEKAHCRRDIGAGF